MREFTQESSWEILSSLQFPAHYVIQDGAEIDRISNHSLKYSSPPYHLFPSIRSEIFLSLLFFSLSLFFFHVIFFFHFLACTASQFKCRNEQCVDSSARCNGVNDCFDHSDELNCREYQKILFLSIIAA